MADLNRWLNPKWLFQRRRQTPRERGSEARPAVGFQMEIIEQVSDASRSGCAGRHLAALLSCVFRC